MKIHKRFRLIWIYGNAVLIGKYFLDKTTIRCEPCLPGDVCPPCQTDFMQEFWMWIIGWNVLVMESGGGVQPTMGTSGSLSRCAGGCVRSLWVWVGRWGC